MNKLVSLSRTKQMDLLRPALRAPVRSITWQVDMTKDRRIGHKQQMAEFRKFISEIEGSSADEHPGWRKEHLKPNEVRQRKLNKLSGKRSVNKVRGILDFIELKGDLKMH